MSDIDHKAESERIMALLNENVIAIEGQTDATMIATAIDALRHATLYAAEQQRTANLIAYSHELMDNQRDGYEPNDDGKALLNHLEAEIREGLGLS